MESNSSNRTSIIIVIIAILLILGAAFILNQSFSADENTNGEDFTSQITVRSSSSSSSSLSSNSNSTSSSSSSLTSSSLSSSLSSSSSSSLSSISSNSTSSSSLTSSSLSSSLSSSSSTNFNLSANQAIATVYEVVDGGGYRIEINQTTFQNGSFWAVGKKFRINTSVKLELNGQYKFINLQETNGSVSYSVIANKLN